MEKEILPETGLSDVPLKATPEEGLVEECHNHLHEGCHIGNLHNHLHDDGHAHGHKHNHGRAKTLKIIVPLLIICVIAGIYLLKNSNSGPEDLYMEKVDLEALFEHELPVLIDFNASWCPVCEEMKPYLEEIFEETHGIAVVRSVDIEKDVASQAYFPVTSLPTQVLYTPDGKPFEPPSNLPLTNMYTYSDPETGELLFTVHVGGLNKAQIKVLLRSMGADI